MHKSYLNIFLAIIFWTVTLLLCSFTLPSEASNKENVCEVTSMREILTEDKFGCTLEEETEYMRLVKNEVKTMINSGIDKNVINNCKIEIYPNSAMAVNYWDTPFAEGTYREKTEGKYKKGTITLAYSAKDEVLYHELGHAFAGFVLNVRGYSWENVNDLGKKYIELRNYKYPLDEKSQFNLPWEDRISEWFAEDIKLTIIEESVGNDKEVLATLYMLMDYKRNAGPMKTQEVDEFIRNIVYVNK